MVIAVDSLAFPSGIKIRGRVQGKENTMPIEQTPLLATQTNRIASLSARKPIYIELPSPAAEPPARRDREFERQMEEPERWDGMG
jgi:hypothetical protein